MNEKEFRIGNILKGYSGQPFEVTIDDLMIIENGDSKAKPMPLTEEWLLKFGFTRHHSDYYNDIILLKDVINHNSGEQYDYFKVKIYPHEIGPAQSVKGGLQIKYLHQLQNLYFVLTNQELTL